MKSIFLTQENFPENFRRSLMPRLVSSSPISPDRSFHPKSGHARLIHKHGRTRARFKLMYCRHYVSSRVNTKNRSTTIRRGRAEFRRLPFSPFPRRRGEEWRREELYEPAKSPGLVSRGSVEMYARGRVCRAGT